MDKHESLFELITYSLVGFAAGFWLATWLGHGIIL